MSKVHRLSRHGSTFINYINGSAKILEFISIKSSHKTKEYREKMSNLKSNYIAQFDLAGNPIAIWDSVNEIHEKLGYTCSVIRCGCNGSKKHPYGYYWRYCDSQGNILDNGYGNKKE